MRRFFSSCWRNWNKAWHRWSWGKRRFRLLQRKL